MMKQLLDVFRHEDPEFLLGSRLSRMIVLAEELVVEAGVCLFDGFARLQDADSLYERDRDINALQQVIRESLVARLELSTATERARFLVVFGLIKDVERLGDYAKNLLEAAEMLPGPLARDDRLVTTLDEIRGQVEASLKRTRLALQDYDAARAEVLLEQGHLVDQRCEQLIASIANSALAANTAVPLALAARYYKRIQKHSMNALTTLTRPLHKVDYFE
jgi:phosphate uptake regulator